jgi:hypothetical protein
MTITDQVAVDERPTTTNLCACGCGVLAGVYVRSRPNRGYVRGQPRQFAPGHRFVKRLDDRAREKRMSHDEILDEWDWLRGDVPWGLFHERVGIAHETWRDLYYRAARGGDPRAVKHWRDER